MIPEYLRPLANHLWQSSLFAGMVGLLTVLLRRNRASLRYCLWLAASVKFLIPFSLLISLGNQLEWRAAPVIVRPQVSSLMGEIGHPFAWTGPAPLWAAVPQTPSYTEALLFGVWLCGLVFAAVSWLREWLRVRVAVRTASPLPGVRLLGRTRIRLLASPALLEPCVFGIFRPVLLLPNGVSARLTPEQLEAIVLHELCHVRRRDNLVAAAHMVVETLFWFYPPAHWIGKRLMEERETACDEEVLRITGSPETYAEGILAVCKFGLRPSPVCAVGVTSSDLKKRIEGIMGYRSDLRLSSGRRFLLALAALTALAGPLVIGIVDAKSSRAQSQPAVRPAFEVASIKRSTYPAGSWFRYLPGGRFTAMSWVQQLIQVAYGVEAYQISGGPGWLTSDRYDIEAKAGNADANATDMKIMLQALLADRFNLKLRRETKEFQVYALVVDKDGPRVRPLKDGEPDTCRMDNSFACGVRTMASLAQRIKPFAGRPVLDKTGLEGTYDIKLDFDVYELLGTTPPPGYNKPPLAAALREQLGLRLEPQKAPLPLLVIEDVQRPTGN